MADPKTLSRALLMRWSSEGGSLQPEEIFSDDYVNHQEPDAAGELSDNTFEEYLAIVETYRRGFPESEVRILLQVEEGDLVATRFSIKAINGGEYLGHAPTGKTAEWTGVEIDRFRDGKIVESWVDWDKYRFMSCLGFI